MKNIDVESTEDDRQMLMGTKSGVSSGTKFVYMCFTLAMIITVISLGVALAAKSSSSNSSSENNNNIVILISIDGFRYDYMGRVPTPNIEQIINRGFRVQKMIPAFPSLTFPNHYTLVTGLYPESHGIVGNTMYDPSTGLWFTLSNGQSANAYWWGGEPIWNTVQKYGYKSGVYFWPGSEAPIGGMYPNYWYPYNGTVTYPERMQTMLSWLDLPLEERPRFLAGYMSAVDSAAHEHGVNAPEVDEAIAEVDSALGILFDGLKSRNLWNDVSIILVSDHGMTDVSPDKIIFIDDYININDVTVVTTNPVLMLIPKYEEKTQEIFDNLTNSGTAMQLWLKADVPPRYHFINNDRITPIVGVADEGWQIGRRTSTMTLLGTHGYDNQLDSMGAFLAAAGPRYQSGSGVISNCTNLAVYSLLTWTLGISPLPNNGSLAELIPYLKL